MYFCGTYTQGESLSVVKEVQVQSRCGYY